MAQRISWVEPDINSVSQVEIGRAESQFGTYTVIDSISATSDGLVKSSSNTWITEYVDVNGERTHWYRIRFFDADTTTWSDYSDAVNSDVILTLCTVKEVKNEIDTIGRFTDSEIFRQIRAVDEDIYMEYGQPIMSTHTDVYNWNNEVPDTFYVGEERIYRVDNVYYGTCTKEQLSFGEQYKVNNLHGMIRIMPYASSGVELAQNTQLEIRYVPKIFNKLAIYETVRRLLERIEFTTTGKPSKEILTAKLRLKEVHTLLNERYAFEATSNSLNYDRFYGVNRKRIRQDHDRNRYVAQYGWE